MELPLPFVFSSFSSTIFKLNDTVRLRCPTKQIYDENTDIVFIGLGISSLGLDWPEEYEVADDIVP